MALTIKLPERVEEDLRQQLPNLEEATRDLLIIEQYKAGRISMGDVAEILDVPTRFHAEKWLAGHGVHQNYTLEELEADRETIRRVLGR